MIWGYHYFRKPPFQPNHSNHSNVNRFSRPRQGTTSIKGLQGGINFSLFGTFPRSSKWMFPKIVVPPNHPILIGLSLINHPFWGTTYFWKHPSHWVFDVWGEFFRWKKRWCEENMWPPMAFGFLEWFSFVKKKHHDWFWNFRNLFEILCVHYSKTLVVFCNGEKNWNILFC